jgi:glycosyltransferase involved in cell wall biosynthesis
MNLSTRTAASPDPIDAALLADGPGVLHRIASTDDGPAARPGTIIHQVVHTYVYGDAVANYAGYLQTVLRRAGYVSEMFAVIGGAADSLPAHQFRPRDLRRADAVIYHHSFGSSAARQIATLPAATALIYHNITPPDFFRFYRSDFARLLERARDALAEDVSGFDRYAADSHFNAADLLQVGCGPVEVMPVLTDFSRFDVAPVNGRFQRSVGTRWLYVGRVAASKGLHRLLRVLHAATAVDPDIQLTIVGRFDPVEPYYRELRAYIALRGLEDRVTFTGIVNEAELAAAYRESDLYVSLSEHEGFCVPLVEAMMFDLPVVALGATAVPETLGPAGMLVGASATDEEIAALLIFMASDRDLRSRVIAAQRQRRRDFFPQALVPRIRQFAADLTR